PQALEFFGEVSGVERAVARRRAANLLELVGLTRAPGNIGGVSRGMTQRLGIALALVGAPRLLVLDEPTSALDPLGRADVLNIIRELAGRTTVLLTSHLLADVQQVCDHVGMLHEGTLLAEGPLDEVLALYRPERATVQVSVARADTEAARSAIAAACGAAGVEAQLDVAPPSLQHVYEYLSRGKVSQ
ncbi:ABC transporter ATP-binding protein, partial [Actinotignum timonense]|uniref:ABC transporter ATP-binding protein n=1 Tax=Actinotignum timonense TaxID=1870995 RepID=UPI002A81D0AA